MPVVDEFLEDLVIKGEASKEYTVVNRRWRLRVLTLAEYQLVYAAAATVEDPAERAAALKIAVLGYALIKVNDVPCDRTKAAEVVDKLPPTIIDKLYDAYAELETDYRNLIRDPDRLQRMVEDNFSRVRYKVMRAVGALPTEERCLRMRDVQWMWYYRNMIEDLRENAKRRRDEIEYLAAFINPEGVQQVQMNRGVEDNGAGKYTNASGTMEVVHKSTRVNDDFEREFRAALGDEKLMDLGTEHQKGNANETEGEFLAKVQSMQDVAQQQNADVFAKWAEADKEQARQQVREEAIKAGVDPDDIDFVEVGPED